MSNRVQLGQGAAYAPAVIAPSGRLVIVSGIVALDADGNIVGQGSVEEQARFIFSQIGKLLAEGGGSIGDIVKITTYLTDMDNMESSSLFGPKCLLSLRSRRARLSG